MGAVNAFELMNAKPRDFDERDPNAWTARARNVIQQIEDVEQQAHAAGLIVTAHQLNEAKNKAGWELAEFMALQLKRRRKK